MHQTPTPIWNEIAQTQRLRSQTWAPLFKMPEAEQHKALEEIEAKLEADGHDPRTILAYLLVAPLLEENVAISAWIEKIGRTDLRNSMPELTSVSEALILASGEYRLMPSQQNKLRALLTQP